MSSEKFCLRWNDFESNISLAFRELRDDKDFFDVTLVCDDEQLQAHKMILSACSPFFKNILRRNPHQHPLLYLKGVKYTDLQSVLNFMYHGEVNVAQEELNSFLAVAEDLQVKGLTQKNATENFSQPKPPTVPKLKHQPRQERNSLPPFNHPSALSSKFSPVGCERDDDIQEVAPVKTEPTDYSVLTTVLPHTQGIYATTGSNSLAQVEDDSYACQDDQYAEYDHYQDAGQYGDGAHIEYASTEEHQGSAVQNPSDLLQFVRRQLDNKYYCTLCDKFSHTNTHHTRNHVESKHFPNTFTYPCDLCDSVFSSSSSFSMHKSRKHKK